MKDKLYTIFINMTDRCNFNCKYCFEKDIHSSHILSQDAAKSITEFVDSLLNSQFYTSNYNGILINFFGGEPTLNHMALKYIVDYFKHNDNIFFSTITNGYKINILQDIFKDIKDYKIDNTLKTHIQISYDGHPVHNMTRLDVKGNPTGDIIYNNIKTMINDGYNISTKSVITPDTFKYMPEAYLDIRKLLNDQGNYFPTIDYYTEYENGYKLQELEDALLEIASYEIDYFNQYHKFFFTWFEPNNNHICSAGKDVIGIEADLNIYPCEGCFSNNKEEHLIGTIFDKDIIDILIERKHYHEEFEYRTPVCVDCDTTTCFKCNVMKYKVSSKKDYLDRWYDYTNQDWLCTYYKTIGKIKKAVFNLLNKGDVYNIGSKCRLDS